MKNLELVKAFIEQLKSLAENEFEIHRIEVLERDLIEGLPQVEIIDDKHQKFDGIVYCATKSGHYNKGRSIHQDVWSYYHGTIPEGDFQIHHIDWNSHNNSVKNLKLVTSAEHRKIHANLPTSEVAPEKTTIFTCEHCGKSFKAAIRQGHKFCCRKCQRLAQLDAKKTSIKSCKFCGKEFAGTENSKFCSRECRRAYASAQIPIKICLQCGKEFKAYSRGKSKKQQLYCSKECQFAAQRASADGICQDNNPNLHIVTCKNCGKEFRTIHPLKCFCSKECGAEWNKKKIHNIKKTCPACGKEFLGTKKQKYCSWECRDEASRTGRKVVEKTCPACGKSFNTHDKRVKYCSKECYRVSKNSAPHVPPKKNFTHTCLQCGKSFMTADKNSKYCSKECYHTATRTLHDRICPTCGKTFRPSGKARKFCSRECIRFEREKYDKTEKQCPICGKKFVPSDNRNVYCSRDCAHIAHQIRPIRQCPVCGKEFRDKPIEQIHCSKHCANIARKLPKKNCPVCGKEFQPHSSKAKYCSKECAFMPLKNQNGGLE